MISEKMKKLVGGSSAIRAMFEEGRKMAEQYGMEVDKLKNIIGERESKAMRSDIAIQKAVDLILESAEEA